MHGQQFSWLATAFFIAYSVAEFPQGWLLQKFPPATVLGINVLLWGVLVSATAACQNFASLLAVRTLLGVFEAVITPALILITSQWYTRRESTPRCGFWYCGLGAGQIIGGLVSFAAQHGSRTASFSGWRIMFVAVGLFNLIIAGLILLLLPNTPKPPLAKRGREDTHSSKVGARSSWHREESVPKDGARGSTRIRLTRMDSFLPDGPQRHSFGSHYNF